MTSPLDVRPIVVAVAGPNGAGKTTFYEAHLQAAGLRFVNADELARELGLGADEAAELARGLRETLVDLGESFVFETIFSDPVGDEVGFLQPATAKGFTVVLCFVGIDGPALSEERVAMRVLQGGHDVPTEKLEARFPRTLANLALAIRELPHVLVYDDSDLARPFHRVAAFEAGRSVERAARLPTWLKQAIKAASRRT